MLDFNFSLHSYGFGKVLDSDNCKEVLVMGNYRIGDKAIDKTGAIFEVEKMEEQDFGGGTSVFLVMKPFFSNDYSKDYRMYVPLGNADKILRPVMTKEQALDLIDQMAGLTGFPEVPPRERKVQFQNIISTGDRKEIYRVIKSLIEYRNKRKQNNKPFSDFDTKLLKNLETMIQNEISVALGISPSFVADFVKQRTGNYLFS